MLDSAGHRYSTPEWLCFSARELMLYFPDRPIRALELGCGAGDLYNPLKQRFSSYVGVDFSPAMLAKFKLKQASIPLICANVSRLPFVQGAYDVVFSNQVCQYFDKHMFRDNLAGVYDLLKTTGVYLIGNIPDAQLRVFYYIGALRGDENISWLRLARYLGAIFIKQKGDRMGHWYSRYTICKLATECGFTCQTFSSSAYEYRFHAVLKKNAG